MPPAKFLVHLNDFLVLTRNGNIISNTLYRKGGLFSDNGYDFLRIIKYVEKLYEDTITKDPKRKKHLASYCCLINTKTGEETKVFNQFENNYLISNAIYSCDSGYYNTYTNELYCKGSNSLSSKNYLFVDNYHDINNDRRGVFQINKQTGEYTIIK